MMVGWIADHMAMGTRDYLNHLVYRRRKLGGELTISRTDPFSAGGSWVGSKQYQELTPFLNNIKN
jgi:hypothetical protein